MALDTVQPPVVVPSSPEELAETLAQANQEGRRLGTDFQLSFERLNRILQYTPDDLTISVEAGVTLGAINQALGQHKQWLPLGAPRPDRTIVAQAIAENPSGPFRLFYGTLRDMVIGVRFATTDGKLIKTGGQVVKNVAGYDLGKLLIGSRQTLAIPVQVNFRVYPQPACRETSTFGFATMQAALAARTAVQKSVLTPLAMDLFDGAAARFISPQELPPGDWVLAIAYGGMSRVIERYRSNLHEIARRAGMISSATLSGLDEDRLWNAVIDFPASMEEHSPDVVRIKVASTISNVGACIAAADSDAIVARAGTGIVYFYKQTADPAVYAESVRRALAGVAESVVVELSSTPLDASTRWGAPSDNFAVMARIKQTIDPSAIANPGTFVGGL